MEEFGFGLVPWGSLTGPVGRETAPGPQAERTISNRVKTKDLIAVPFFHEGWMSSGAGWFPAIFDYADETGCEESSKFLTPFLLVAGFLLIPLRQLKILGRF